jgi:hypothetical protein
MIKASLSVSCGNLLVEATRSRLTACGLVTDVASGDLKPVRDPLIETQLKDVGQLRELGLALVRFADLLSGEQRYTQF